MARLKHAVSGVIVNVADEKVARLGSEWVPVDAAKSATPRSDVPDSSWKVKELQAYAEAHEIDLGDAKKKDDIVAAIALAEAATDDGEESDDSGDDGDDSDDDEESDDDEDESDDSNSIDE